jgi:putative ABC transport system permease protein
MISTIPRELRQAARAVARKPAFSLVVVATIALSTAAAAVIWGMAYGVLFQPLPYPAPDQLVGVWQVNASGGQVQFSDPNFEDVRDGTRAFTAFAQYNSVTETVIVSGVPERAEVAAVSRQFFEVFQTPPMRGRLFADDERAVGAPRVAVVSRAVWERASTTAAGAEPTLTMGGAPYVIVGVMPPQFDFPAGAAVWTPREQSERNPHRTGHNWRAVGRLALPLETARRDASAVARQLAVSLGSETQMADLAIVPLRDQVAGASRQPLLVLLGAVVCLVLIAAANLTNLFLAHATARRREVAVRAALGASAPSLALPLVAEIALLTGAGAAAGVLLGSALLRGTLALVPAGLPRASEIGVSWPVAAVSIGGAIATAVVLAAAVAWSTGHLDLMAALKQGPRGQTGRASSGRVRSVLVVAQLAVSLVLLVGAGLLGRSLAALLGEAPGFRTEQVLAIDLDTPGEDAVQLARRVDFYDRALERLSALPGVDAAGGVNRFPLGTGYANGTYARVKPGERFERIDDLQTLFQDRSRTGTAEFRIASAGYFAAMGIPLRAGRTFDPRDTADAPHVAIVSESMARGAWPDQDPIGQLLQFGNMDGDLRVFTVVGVVGDIRERGLDSAPRPVVYAFYRQRPRHAYSFTFALHATNDVTTLVAPARSIIRELDAGAAPRFRTIDQVFDASVADRRFNLLVLATFATAALLLASLGLYGVLAYVVTQRTQEFGIRMALGAARADVWRLVLGQASTLVAAGIVLGTVASWALTRLMASLLYGVQATDPVTFVVVAVALAAIALLACQLPALRATRVDPIIALRAD